MAKCDRQRGNRTIVVHEAVKARPLVARFIHAIAGHHQRTRQDS